MKTPFLSIGLPPVVILPLTSRPGVAGPEGAMPPRNSIMHSKSQSAGKPNGLTGPAETASPPIASPVAPVAEDGAASGNWSFGGQEPPSLTGLFSRVTTFFMIRPPPAASPPPEPSSAFTLTITISPHSGISMS